MKILFLFGLFFFTIQLAYGQEKASKPPVDTNAIRIWPSPGTSRISNNGKYVIYTIENVPLGSRTLVLQSSDGKWKRDIPHASTALQSFITENSKYVIYNKPNDTLAIFTLGKSLMENIPNVKGFIAPNDGIINWIAYKTNKDKLVLRDFKNRKEKIYDSVVDYLFSDNGKVLLIKSSNPKAAENQLLTWISLDNDLKATLIWEGNNAGHILFDRQGTQLAFTSVEENIKGGKGKRIFYYKQGQPRAVSLIDDSELKIQEGFLISNINCFSKDGTRLFIYTNEVVDILSKIDPNAVKVNIWSYTDSRLQSEQIKMPRLNNNNLTVLDLASRKIIPIQKRHERIYFDNTKYDDFLVVYSWINDSGENENHWNPNALRDVYLVSTKDGSRKSLSRNTLLNYFSSPKGKFLVFYDPKQHNYFSYEIANGHTTNITSKIKDEWTLPNKRPEDDEFSFMSNFHVAGWSEEDSSILFYNHNDIWKVNLLGYPDPVNLTNGYGKKNNIQFFIALKEDEVITSNSKKLILIGYNENNKDNGFYTIDLNKQTEPICLTMAPYAYCLPGIRWDNHGFEPVKAKYANVYLVQRMSAIESPNYFVTSDFKVYKQLSDLSPENKYNWLTTELHTWTDATGTLHQGVLFKPENFNPNKKYPLILYYYETLSDLKNIYIQPGESNGAINITSYVSNGYLVFTPDIHYKFGETGQSALTAVVSATNYLSKFSFINKEKIGIQGWSFGGFETNYIVTHSNLFAAACSVAGLSNLISWQGQIGEDGTSYQSFVEQGQLRMAASLWDKPNLYIDNSPIFNLDKVTTPILLMHNIADDTVPFSQGIELFTSLRRLRKPVWLLEYEDGNHGVAGKSGTDFTIRMQQFFDYYLKDALPSRWMTEGRPANLKGVETRLELDTTGIKPGEGFMLSERKGEIDSLMKRKPVKVTLE